MDKHREFLDVAIGLARDSAESGGYPFGAVIVLDGKIVGDSSNRGALSGTSINHAELAAVINANATIGADLSGCVLYSSCQPCGMCMGAVKWAGIREIYYAVDKNDAEKIGFQDEIFADDSADIRLHKIADDSLSEYMKTWYKANN
ncbi:MAG: nucleoside deaminase [Rickettsiales bacterium]|jgi:tRNA(Arg) A34 adenosine deaminase TadA|nr:nucleoside deaminase [Rickettsiales bacterium]